MAGIAAIPRPKISVTLSNRWAAFRCSPELQLRLKLLFRYRVPGAEFSARYKSGEWDGFRHMLQRGRVPCGLFLAQREAVEKKFELLITDQRHSPKFKTVVASPGERPYQRDGVQAMIDNSNVGGIVLVATGAGKTRMMAEYFRRLDGTAVFIVDELTLLKQARREIQKVLKESVGVVGRSEFDPQRITVATIQTLAKHRSKPVFQHWFDRLSVITLDEFHLSLNKRNIDLIQQIRPYAVFGLTATIELQKPEIGFPASALAGPVIFRYLLQEGVEEGYLSKGVVTLVQFQDPLQGRSPGYWTERRVKGEGLERFWVPSGSEDADYRYHICLNAARNRLIEKLVRHALTAEERTVVLVHRRLHLYTLAKRFPDIAHRALCGEQSPEYRQEAVRMMDAGELPLILASGGVFGKGVDIKSVDLIIDATALPGRNSVLQRYGRGTRKTEGKRGLKYKDISDLGNRFAIAAKSRRRALQETGARIITLPADDLTL